MSKAEEHLKNALKLREEQHLLREASVHSGRIDFASNDYLGFAKQPVHITASSGAGASRLITGYSNSLEKLEFRLADMYKSSHATLFNSGFEANHGLFDMLTSQGINILYDEYIHASIRSGLTGKRVKTWAFKHNSIADLKEKLAKLDGPVVVVTEGLFSMNGTTAPLKEIVGLKDEFDFALVVDEAHSTGTFGTGLTGLTGKLNLIQNVDIRIHTFGKALGSQGACIVGDSTIHAALQNFCKPLIYSTAPSPLFVTSIRTAHERLSEIEANQQLLNDNISHFKTGISGNGSFQQGLDGPIQWWKGSSVEVVIEKAEQLKNQGFDVVAIRPPTVSPGHEGIRICLHAFNNYTQIDALLEGFND